jgi:hypothetical protein
MNSRTRIVQFSALNVAMHDPHSPQKYVDLLREIFKRRDAVRLGELHMAMMGDLYSEHRDAPSQGMIGEFFRFVNLDANEPWFNTQTRETASEDDLSRINIPDHLLPHLSRIPFFFTTSRHQLWFVKRDRKDGLSVAQMARLFERLSTPLVDAKLFPPIEITPLPQEEQLNRMLNIHTLEKLCIELKRPNSDDGEDEQARWQKKLENQKAGRLKLELASLPSSSIEPDDETRSLARVAASNGRVEIVGRNISGEKVIESTERHPLTERVRYDPDSETIVGILKRLADR